MYFKESETTIVVPVRCSRGRGGRGWGRTSGARRWPTRRWRRRNGWPAKVKRLSWTL